MACYFVYSVILFFICKQLSGFDWTIKAVQLIFQYTFLAVLSFLIIEYQLFLSWRLFSLGLLAVATTYSCYELNKIMDLRLVVVKILQKLGFKKVA